MKKCSIKRFGVTLLALFLLCNANIITAHAVVVPDLDREGSIKIIMRDSETGSVVSGGTVTLFKAGNVKEDDGNFSFVPADEFADSGESMEKLNAELAKQLADYAGKHDINGTTITIDSNGTARFADVEPGLYLLVQEQAAEGYYIVDPFLVSIPLLENGSYIYDVDASPKMEPLSRKPDEPGKVPDSPAGPARTGDNSNPMLWIVLLVLSALGFAGTLITRRK